MLWQRSHTSDFEAIYKASQSCQLMRRRSNPKAQEGSHLSRLRELSPLQIWGLTRSHVTTDLNMLVLDQSATQPSQHPKAAQE